MWINLRWHFRRIRVFSGQSGRGMALRNRDMLSRAGAGAKRGASERLYLSTGLNLTRPTSIRITLTERCNYRCRYCNHWRQDSYPDELNLDDWKRNILSLGRFLGPFPLQFLGGEPFIWPGFLELAAFCRSNGVRWGVITNGSALGARAVAAVVEAHPTNVDVSIDSRNAGIHDHARGVIGSSKHIEAGVDRLAAARRAAGQTFPIRIKPTVHRTNLETLPEVVQWAASKEGVLVDFSPVRLWADTAKAEHYPSTPAELQALEQVVARLIDMKRAGFPIETSEAKLQAINKHFAGEIETHAYQQCRVGLRTFDIYPDGEVQHCWKYAIGNLRESTPEDIWHGSARKQTIADTLACDLAGGNVCGTACTSHRSPIQEVRRAFLYLRKRSK